MTTALTPAADKDGNNNNTNIKHTHQTRTVNTKSWFKVCCLMECMFEAFSKSMAVGSNKICFHFTLANHPIPVGTINIQLLND